MKKNSSTLRFGVWALSVATVWTATVWTAAFGGAAVRSAEVDPSAAPFVDRETQAFVRLNLAQIDLDACGNVCVQEFARFLQQQGFDETSVVKTTREFKRTVDGAKNALRPQLDRLRETFGIDEATFVCQKFEKNGSARLVVPTSPAKQGAAKGFLASLPFDAQETPNALIFVPKVDGAADYYANFKPTANARLDGALEKTDGATVQLYLGNFDLRVFLEADDAPEEIAALMKTAPQEIDAAISAFDQYFVDAEGSIDLNALTASLRLNFTTAKHADEVLAGLKKWSDLGAEALEKSLVDNADNAATLAEFNVPALAREVARGFLASELPKRDGVSLVWSGKFDGSSTIGNPAVAGVCVGALVPLISAVQSARDAADRLRAANLEKQAELEKILQAEAAKNAAETKAPETAPTESQPAETVPTESQPVETAPTESQPAETAPTESQPVETAPTESQPAETAPTETELDEEAFGDDPLGENAAAPAPAN